MARRRHFDETKIRRWPAQTPDSKGGEFRDKGTGAVGWLGAVAARMAGAAGAAGAPRVVRGEHPVTVGSGQISVRGGDHVRVRAGYAWRASTSRDTKWAGTFDVELTPGSGGGGRPHHVGATRGHPAGWVMEGYLLNQNGTRKKGEPTRLFIIPDLVGIKQLGEAPWQAKAAAKVAQRRSAPLPPERRTPAKASLAVRRRLDTMAATLPGDELGWQELTSRMRPKELEIDREIAQQREDIDFYEGQKRSFDAITDNMARSSIAPGALRVSRDGIWDHSHQGIALAEARVRLKRLERQRAAGPTSSTQHLFREAPPKAIGHRYDTDDQGTPIPPEALRRHLETTLDAGRRLHDELQKLLDKDRQYVELDRQLEGDGSHSQSTVDELWRRGDASYQTRAGQRTLMIQRRADRRRQVILQMLASVRGYGHEHHTDIAAASERDRDGYNAHVRNKDHHELPPHPDFLEHIHTAEGYYPDDWIATSSFRQGRMRVASRYRAHHRENEGVLATGIYASTQWSSNGFPSTYEETNVHELAHRMEGAIPGLKALEFAYVRRRATVRGRVARASKLKTLFPHSGYDDGEWSFEDQWADAYSGKTYEGLGARGIPADGNPARHSWELFSTGMQDLFSGVPRFDRGVELQHFTLGVLALLARQRRT